MDSGAEMAFAGGQGSREIFQVGEMALLPPWTRAYSKAFKCFWLQKSTLPPAEYTTSILFPDPCTTRGNISYGSLWIRWNNLGSGYKEWISERQIAWAKWGVSWRWVPGLSRKIGEV